MNCSSLNLDHFIVRLLRRDGLYSFLEEIQGLTSPPGLSARRRTEG